MSTMQSTVRRIEGEAAYGGAEPDGGWQPAGPVLTESETVMDMAKVERAKEFAERDLPDVPQAEWVTVKRLDDDTLPSIGHLVVFHLREGDARSRRTNFPAIVMVSDAETRRLNLCVIVDAEDIWMQENVPARVGPEQGWVPVAQPEGPNELSLTVARLGDRIGELEHDIEVLGK